MKYKQAVAYMVQSFVFAELSHATRRKTGSIIIKEVPDGRHQILSNGYNGTKPNSCNKCEDSDGVTLDYDTVIHAERNALDKLKLGEANGATLFVTRYPCPKCTELIRKHKIKTVYYCEISEDTLKLGDLTGLEVVLISKRDVLEYIASTTYRLTKNRFN